MKVNRVVELPEFLDSGSVAAPERVVRRCISLPEIHANWVVVHRSSRFEIHCAKTVIEDDALVVVHVACLRRPAEEMPRELHHVIGAAIFGRARTKLV